jgi:hopanoid biosynthesis associated protein HpnK
LKRIVVTADDFGAAREVNDAVEEAHRRGILTAASLMVGAPHASDAIARARRVPSLRVGLHLVLVEGEPLLPPQAVSELVDRSGAFRTDMAAMGAAIFFGAKARRQVEAEITAQFEAFRASGLELDHVNAHKHYHLHPTVGRLILEIGRRCGMRAVRVPIESRAILAQVESGAAARGWFTVPWARALRRRLVSSGMQVPDNVFGLAWSGAMTTARLAGLIRNAPDGLSEIYLHPATGSYAGSAHGYRYAEEFAALTSDEARSAARDSNARLGGFLDFLPANDGAKVLKTAPQASENRSFL